MVGGTNEGMSPLFTRDHPDPEACSVAPRIPRAVAMLCVSRHTKAMGITVIVCKEELGLPIVSVRNL